MICTDCIGSYKSNYHTITPKAAFSLSLLPIFFTTWFIQKNVIILACIRCISIKIVVLPHHVFSLTHFLNLVIVALMVHYSVTSTLAFWTAHFCVHTCIVEKKIIKLVITMALPSLCLYTRRDY
jgi:hypothetical protein